MESPKKRSEQLQEFIQQRGERIASKYHPTKEEIKDRLEDAGWITGYDPRSDSPLFRPSWYKSKGWDLVEEWIERDPLLVYHRFRRNPQEHTLAHRPQAFIALLTRVALAGDYRLEYYPQALIRLLKRLLLTKEHIIKYRPQGCPLYLLGERQKLPKLPEKAVKVFEASVTPPGEELWGCAAVVLYGKKNGRWQRVLENDRDKEWGETKWGLHHFGPCDNPTCYKRDPLPPEESKGIGKPAAYKIAGVEPCEIPAGMLPNFTSEPQPWPEILSVDLKVRGRGDDTKRSLRKKDRLAAAREWLAGAKEFIEKADSLPEPEPPEPRYKRNSFNKGQVFCQECFNYVDWNWREHGCRECPRCGASDSLTSGHFTPSIEFHKIDPKRDLPDYSPSRPLDHFPGDSPLDQIKICPAWPLLYQEGQEWALATLQQRLLFPFIHAGDHISKSNSYTWRNWLDQRHSKAKDGLKRVKYLVELLHGWDYTFTQELLTADDARGGYGTKTHPADHNAQTHPMADTGVDPAVTMQAIEQGIKEAAEKWEPRSLNFRDYALQQMFHRAFDEDRKTRPFEQDEDGNLKRDRWGNFIRKPPSYTPKKYTDRGEGWEEELRENIGSPDYSALKKVKAAGISTEEMRDTLPQYLELMLQLNTSEVSNEVARQELEVSESTIKRCKKDLEVMAEENRPILKGPEPGSSIYSEGGESRLPRTAHGKPDLTPYNAIQYMINPDWRLRPLLKLTEFLSQPNPARVLKGGELPESPPPDTKTKLPAGQNLHQFISNNPLARGLAEDSWLPAWAI